MKSEEIIISIPKKNCGFHFAEFFHYRDLIGLFVKRNYTTRYKQTILGHAWLIISPLFTILCYTLVFGGIARLPTDGIPKPLFYLTGNILWLFFSECVNGTSGTFRSNIHLFSKVYFPRLTVPVSTIFTNVIDFFIRLLLLICFMLYYIASGWEWIFSFRIFLVFPVILQLALLALGTGLIITSLTTKYRDLQVLADFGMRIWMYGSPVIYSLSSVPKKWLFLIKLNPVTSSMLIFKSSFLGLNEYFWLEWSLSWGITIIILFIGLFFFSKTERTFSDMV